MEVNQVNVLGLPYQPEQKLSEKYQTGKKSINISLVSRGRMGHIEHLADFNHLSLCNKNSFLFYHTIENNNDLL